MTLNVIRQSKWKGELSITNRGRLAGLAGLDENIRSFIGDILFDII